MIRTYSNKDKEQIVELFRLNVPKFFHASEENELKKYLENEIEDYFVVEDHSKIIGSGGINYSLSKKTACLSWGMIAPDFQGKGIGRKLTEHRVNTLKENTDIESIIVRTSQHTCKFYEKMGFQLDSIEKDFWAKNFDLYNMTMNNNTK